VLIFRQHKLFYHENYEREEYIITEREGIDINVHKWDEQKSGYPYAL